LPLVAHQVREATNLDGGQICIDEAVVDERPEQRGRKADPGAPVRGLGAAGLENRDGAAGSRELGGHGAPGDRPSQDADVEARGACHAVIMVERRAGLESNRAPPYLLAPIA